MKNEDAPPTIITKINEKPKDKEKGEYTDKNDILITGKPIEEEKTDEPQKNEIIIEKTMEEENNKKLSKINIIKTGEEKKISQEIINYPKSLFGNFEFYFPFENLKPNCTYIFNDRKYYVFFNLQSLYNKIEETMKKLFDKYPKNLENLKEPLKIYMEKHQNKIYEENTSFFGTIFERIKLIFGKEAYCKEAKDAAIGYAFLLSQLKSKELKNNDLNQDIIIGTINSFNYEILTYPYEDFKKIHEEVEDLDIKLDNMNEINNSLKLIEEKMKIMTKYLEKKYNDNNLHIFILYLSKVIDSKLEKFQDLNIISYDSEAFKKMREIKSKINQNIITNIKKERKALFFDFEFDYKILKNTLKDKMIILSGINMNSFYDELYKNFEDLRDHLLKFEKDELEGEEITTQNKMKYIEFIRKKIENLQKLEELENKIDTEINELNFNTLDHVVDIAGQSANGIINAKIKNVNAVTNNIKSIGTHACKVNENNIKKKFAQKTHSIIKYKKEEIVKLIKEYELIVKICEQRKKVKEKTKINGYSISKKINDNNNQLLIT